MTPKIFVGHDFFGAGNFGDDLMLAGFLHSLARSCDHAEVVACIPHDIDGQRLRFPGIKWLASADGQSREDLRSSRVWLGLGGTPFQVASGPWSLDHLDREREVCRQLGKPMVFLGVGCESVESVWDPRARRVIESADRIWARDARSADAISRVAAPGVVTLGADLAHIALSASPKPPHQTRLLGLLLGLDASGVVDLAAVEQAITRRSPAKTRWLVQEARSFPCTERWNYAGLSQGARNSVDIMPADYSTDTIDRFLTNFGAPETVVSSRYHGALIAAWHGCRLSVIARTEKLNGVVSDFAVPSTRRIHQVHELESLVHEAVPVKLERLEALKDRADGMCEAFFEWVREI